MQITHLIQIDTRLIQIIYDRLKEVLYQIKTIHGFSVVIIKSLLFINFNLNA